MLWGQTGSRPIPVWRRKEASVKISWKNYAMDELYLDEGYCKNKARSLAQALCFEGTISSFKSLD